MLLVVSACRPAPPPVASPPAPAVQKAIELEADHLSEVTPPLDIGVLTHLRAGVVSLRTPTGSGSGVLIHNAAGQALIITNAHVVNQFRAVGVSWYAGQGLPSESLGRVLAVADDLDLALLETAPPDGRSALTLAPHVSLPPRSALFAAGFPYGTDDLEQGGFPSVTVTSGTNFPTQRTDARGLELFLGGVNPGNSGGAAVDLDGRLRGVVAAYYPTTELSELVPAEHVLAFVGRVRPDVHLAWASEAPRPTHFGPRWESKRSAPLPSLTVVQSALGVGVGAILEVTPDSMLVATASWVVGSETTPHPVLVSSWEGGALRGGAWAQVVLNQPSEGLALIRTGLMRGVQAVTLPEVMPPLLETQPVWANLMHLTGSTVLRQGTLSAVWWGASSAEALKVDLGVQTADLGGLVFDAQNRLLGLTVISVSGTNLTTIVPAARLKALLRGHLRGAWAQLDFDGYERCAIGMTVQVTDPLGRITRAGLSVARGLHLQPEEREAIPQVGYRLASVPVTDGYAHVTAVISPCLPGQLTVQPFVEGVDFVERSPAYPMEVGPQQSELLMRGVFFAGRRRALLPRPRVPQLGSNVCASGDWEQCLVDCQTGGSLDACFEFGKHLLAVDPLGPRELATALTYMTTACRGAVPMACEALRELNPAVETGNPLEVAADRCGQGELLNCLLLERSPERDRQLCFAGVGTACARAAEVPENEGFAASLGCDAADAESCLRRALREQLEPVERVESARRSCGLGLPAGCLAMAWLSNEFPEEVRPEEAARAFAQGCAGRKCPQQARLAKNDIVPGKSTTLAAALVARARRVAPPAVVAAPGTQTWVVDRPDMADIGVVQLSVSKPELVAPQELLRLKDAAPLTARCLLVRLSYSDWWMNLKAGAMREVKLRNTGVGPNPSWKEPRVLSCLGPIQSVFGVPPGVVLTIRVTRG